MSEKYRKHRGTIYGTPTNDTDPAEVLLNEIRRTAGHIEWLRERLQESDPEMFVHSLWLRGRQSGYVNAKEIDTTDWSQAGALWVELYLKERSHLASICRTALAAGIEERRIRLAERLAERVGEAIRGMLYDLGLDPEDDQVRSVVYKWLSQAQGLEVGNAKAIS
jgi:catalase